MPFPTFDRSKRQATDSHPMQRRHIAALVVAGVVVASSAFALPALASAGDAPTADAAATVPTSATTAIPDTAAPETVAPITAAPETVAPDTTAPEATTPAPDAPAPAPADPAADFAASVSAMTPDQRAAFALYLATPDERAAFFAFIAPPAPEPAPAPAAAPAPAPGGFLACVRQRESHGNYAVNTGNGYFGAYQFSQSTWNNTARHAGRGDLVGVRPSSAAPSDQDAMAQSLYSWQGRSPWNGPGC